MTDMFSSEKRSELMSKIRSENSKAELIVFAYLRHNHIYFQKHYKRAIGRPDIALPRKKLAVFIDGDFWHGRTLEKIKTTRRNPDDYWIIKLESNISRDERQNKELVQSGWKVMRVWESDIIRKRTSAATLDEIARFLTQ